PGQPAVSRGGRPVPDRQRGDGLPAGPKAEALILRRNLLMRPFALTVLVVGIGLLLPAALPADDKAEAERIARLVAQLGSDSFTKRAEADRALEEIGAAALPALRKAAQGKDLEIRLRAKKLIQKIEKRGANGRLLVPTRVRLVYKNTPLAVAVADFARKT